VNCSLELSVRKIYQVLSQIPPPEKQAEKSQHEMWSGSGDCFRDFPILWKGLPMCLDLLIRVIVQMKVLVRSRQIKRRKLRKETAL